MTFASAASPLLYSSSQSASSQPSSDHQGERTQSARSCVAAAPGEAKSLAPTNQPAQTPKGKEAPPLDPASPARTQGASKALLGVLSPSQELAHQRQAAALLVEESSRTRENAISAPPQAVRQDAGFEFHDAIKPSGTKPSKEDSELVDFFLDSESWWED